MSTWHGNEKLRSLLAPLEKIRLDPKNARKHSQRNLRAIRASFDRSGQQTPIVISKRSGLVVRGNGTVDALRLDPAWTEVAVLEADFDSDRTEREYAVADNRSAELAEWSSEQLSEIFEDMTLKDIDLLGFDRHEIDAFLPPRFDEEKEDPQNQRLDLVRKTTCPECGHVF